MLTTMKYDETELIEFFGVLPSEQNPDEMEFFGTTIFDYHQNQFHLCVSFSTYSNDFYLDLKDAEHSKPIIELSIERVEEIRVRRDKPRSAPVLLVKAGNNTERNEKEEQMQTIEIMLEPSISIRINNHTE
jgi:hypothetical protein